MDPHLASPWKGEGYHCGWGEGGGLADGLALVDAGLIEFCLGERMGDPVSVARRLRRDQTEAERRFWALLYPWRFSGWHFRRQAPVGVYFVDFICKREKLIFEIDGGAHYSDEGVARDARRTAVLEAAGYRVVRFSNDDVLRNANGMGEVLVGILGEPGGSGS